jgi:hypothetical protein
MKALKLVEKKNEIVKWELMEDGVVTISGVFGPLENVLPYYKQAMLKMHFHMLEPAPKPNTVQDWIEKYFGEEEGTDWERARKRHPLLGLALPGVEP